MPWQAPWTILKPSAMQLQLKTHCCTLQPWLSPQRRTLSVILSFPRSKVPWRVRAEFNLTSETKETSVKPRRHGPTFILKTNFRRMVQLLDFSLHFRKMFMHGFQSVAFKHDKYNRTNRPTLAGANNSFVSDLSSIPSFLVFTTITSNLTATKRWINGYF